MPRLTGTNQVMIQIVITHVARYDGATNTHGVSIASLLGRRKMARE